MICIDTNCWIGYLAGDRGDDIQRMDTALEDGSVVMAPPVLSELLTDPAFPPEVERELLIIPLMELLPDFWVRAGRLRSALRRRGYRPKLVDTMIAQCCIDHEVRLLTRDRDFRAFARYGGLSLLA